MNPTVITLCFLAFAIIMFVLEKIPLGLTATIVSVGLCVTGVLEPKQAFAGYVDSNVILCVAMFVVGQALFETGMANKIGGLVTKFAKSERQLIIAIMVITGLMSGFLSNTGSAAVLIPVVVGIAAESGYSRSHLLMPLVFAAALGGNISIIGAPGNLMGVSALNELGIETSFFEYLIVGGPMMLAGILYFALFGYKLLPKTAARHRWRMTSSLSRITPTFPSGSSICRWLCWSSPFLRWCLKSRSASSCRCPHRLAPSF